ncbi:hypothetical protein [Aurantiacibacter aquimixticola]|uniref:Uncharacterized protein n=1 Tax=Aurantiacibacter aquimixticola TaxID=1958945 RepID=A0A419RUH3_9SPHN|nr:hypothetical protein [Aurantiacibacter aquimixticola]RJY09441.1 hypothetical protein D6201_08805 [Aurantiacibacter aquimixticola]
MAALAGIVMLAQLDRSARFAPQLAPLVPQAFSGFAAEERTRLAIAARDEDRALAEAKALVRSRPVAGEHLAQLAVAAALAGEPELSASALEAASVRGWREPLSQFAAARIAIAAGAPDIAAQRIVALLSTGQLPEETAALFAAHIRTPEGREAMARRYAAFGRWQVNSLSPLASASDANDFAATIALALELGAELPCDRVKRLTAIACS